MRISKRLELLSNEVKGYNTICDVGCDHGLFSIYSILNQNIKHAYLLDVNIEPLNSAKKNCIKYDVSNQVTYLLSDGLINFEEELDCLVISGIGGYLMTKILNDSLSKVNKANKLILQPNSDFEILRKFLFENGFTITYENMILDNNKYCYYLTAINKNSKYCNEDILYGPILRNNISNIYKEYWTKKYNNLIKELDNIKDNNQLNKIKENINNIKNNIL